MMYIIIIQCHYYANCLVVIYNHVCCAYIYSSWSIISKLVFIAASLRSEWAHSLYVNPALCLVVLQTTFTILKAGWAKPAPCVLKVTVIYIISQTADSLQSKAGIGYIFSEILSGCLEYTSLLIARERMRGCISSKPLSCCTQCFSSQTSCPPCTCKIVWLLDPYRPWWQTQVEWKIHFPPHGFCLHTLFFCLFMTPVQAWDAGETI